MKRTASTPRRCGSDVLQADRHNTADEKQAYEQAWRLTLRELLGWPDTRAADWARWEIQRTGDNPFLTHEHEAWQVAPMLVPDDVKARLGPRLNAFRANIEMTVQTGDPHGLNALDTGYDWAETRRRVDRLLVLARQGVDPDAMGL